MPLRFRLCFSWVVLAAATGLAACKSKPPDLPLARPPQLVAGGIAPGADRDAQGCIPSAGYAWCERSQRCERPWELAQQQGLPPTAEAFHRYCRVQGTPAPR